MPKFTINIDFDEASRQWRIHTQADNPTALRKRQRQYWREVRKAAGPIRRSSRTTSTAKKTRSKGDTTTNGGGRTRGSKRRRCGPPKRLIDEC
jgi:hypothetical protein